MTQSRADGHDYRFPKQLAGDLVAAGISATLVTPATAIIDRAVVEKVASHEPFLRTLWTHTKSAVTRPGSFVFSRPFGILWTLYAATFSVANASETIVKDWRPAAVGTVTLVATVLVNVPLGIWKDLRFAKIYGGAEANKTPSLKSAAVAQPATAKVAAPPVPVSRLPKAPAAVFLLRDSLTLYGSFVLPQAVTNLVSGSTVASAHATALMVQLLVPASTQLVATPVHLLGLDMYNRPQKGLTLSDRFAHTKHYFGSATALRCMRVLPAFGFGVMANRDLRNYFHPSPKEGSAEA
ncbi:hypothetical protein M426DRAFT_15411 [Hypoxylon sp. CI-4A]|nr:hypothetical protein M426DRAFT_15411 [Hypoxylon sp. CI-4A]